jgi:hypothetical protein
MFIDNTSFTVIKINNLSLPHINLLLIHFDSDSETKQRIHRQLAQFTDNFL